MDDQMAVILVGPWLARMGEAEFLSFLLGRLQAAPPQVRQIQLYDLCLDVVLPPGCGERAD